MCSASPADTGMQISEPFFSCQIGKILTLTTSVADKDVGKRHIVGVRIAVTFLRSSLLIPVKNIPTVLSSDFPLGFISSLNK